MKLFHALALSSALTAPLGLSAMAESTSFDFADPKGVNGVVFVVDSVLEPIVGISGGVGGVVEYDPAAPTSLAGSISVDLGKMSLVNSKMLEVARGSDWLNIKDVFKATFEIKEVKSASEEAEPMLTVSGVLKFGGKEIEKDVEIQVTHLPDSAKDRGGAKEGDLLVLRSMFRLSRIELGIKTDMTTEKVGDEIMVMVPIVGYSK